MSKQERPKWAKMSATGYSWWSTEGNREMVIKHMGAHKSGGIKQAEERLDRLLESHPEAATLTRN